jgi:hypothetical protein
MMKKIMMMVLWPRLFKKRVVKRKTRKGMNMILTGIHCCLCKNYGQEARGVKDHR